MTGVQTCALPICFPVTIAGLWVKIKSNGNILTGGHTSSKNIDIPVNYGQTDDWIVEFTPDGKIVNNKVYGNIYAQYSYNGITTTDGGFLLTSVSSGVEGMVQGVSHGFDDIWLVKLDKEYNNEWQSLYGGEYRDWETDRKSTRLNSSHRSLSRMPSSA